MRNSSHRINGRFAPGHPGGPGRPKGSKHKLSEAFIAALARDFEEHGTDAIRRVCQDDPSTYLRVIASLVPKDMQVSSKPSVLDELTDNELAQFLTAIRQAIAEQDAAQARHDQDEGRPERLQ